MDIAKAFGERLQELIEERCGTTKRFIQASGFVKSSTNDWIAGKRAIKRNQLIRLADFFDCSVEYLVGKTDILLDYTPKPCPPFYDRLRELLEQEHKSCYNFVKVNKFYDSYLTNWKNGSDPNIYTLEKSAQYFGCTIDYLIGRDR